MERDRLAMTATLTVPETTPVAPPTAPNRIAWKHLQEWRNERARRRPDLKVRSEAEALAFLNDVGCAFLFPQAGVTLPSLWDAINGRERALPHHHHDHALGLTWSWKDSL